MGVNKVIYYGEVLVDMSQVTVTPETLGKGTTALDAKGDLITGTHECAKTEPKLQSKTVTPTTSLQTVNPDSGYDGLSKVTVNAMPTATQATPSISVDTAGKITASATQTAGYVSAGTKSATKQLTTQAAQTITPSTSNKTIASGRYLTGTQTIKGDANLVAGNIKKGVSIFGVNGSYEGSGGSGGGGSVETCTVTINGLLGDDSAPWITSHDLTVCATISGTDGLTPYYNRFEGTLTIPNVAKGSVLALVEHSGMMNGAVCDGGVTEDRVGLFSNICVFSVNGDGTITTE